MSKQNGFLLSSAVMFLALVVVGYAIYAVEFSRKAEAAVVVDVVSKDSWVQNVLETRYKVRYPASRLVAHTLLGAAEAEAVPVTILMAQVHIESSYRGGVIGKHKEIGFMQVKEKYWGKVCKRYNIHDRYENIYVGACALRWNRDKTDNMEDALVAYNIGMGDFENQVDVFRGFVYRDKVLKEFHALQQLALVEVDTH